MKDDKKVNIPTYQSQLIRALFPENRPHKNGEVRHQMFDVLTGARHGDDNLQDATQTIERWGLSRWENDMNSVLDALEDLSTAAFISHVYCGGSFSSRFALSVHRDVKHLREPAAIAHLVCGAYRGFAQCIEYILTRDEGTRKVMQIELALAPCYIGASCEAIKGAVGKISNEIATILSKEKAKGVKVSTATVVIEEFWKFTPNLADSSLADVIARDWAIKAFACIDTIECLGVMKRYFEPLYFS